MVPTLALAWSAAAHADPAYIRTPDLYGDQVVFAATGDLWLGTVAGGVPRQLTTSPGDETQPSFSPDGSKIAFTAQYDGNTDVYVIPTAGGEPKRLTWGPYRDEVIDWTADGKVVFRTNAYEAHTVYELFTVDAGGGDPVKLPVGWGARVAIEPGTNRWALDRIGYERRTWKRYRGGMAGDLWVGTPEADFTQVTSSAYAEGFPMWSGGRLYFLSDRGGTSDLWSMAPDGSGATRHTDGGQVAGQAWDARTPSVGNDGRIVFVRGGDLHLFDPKTAQEKTIPVDLQAERVMSRRRYPDVKQQMSWYTISPDGDRVLIVARGEVFSIPVEDGVVLPVTQTSGARESWATFSPDGKRVVYVTDASGEEAIVTADAWGRGSTVTVAPPAASGWHFWPVYSGDGKRIAWADSTQTLWAAPADGGAAPKQVDHADQSEIRDYVWSPDGRYLAYSKLDRLDYGAVWVWDSQTGKTTRVSPGTTDDHEPAWDPDGRYLYYVSERATNPLLGGRDFQVIEARNSRLMVVLLRDDVENPFADDAGVPGAEPPVIEEKKVRKKKRQQEEEVAAGPKPIAIDWDGIVDRQVAMPIERGSFHGLAATSTAVFWMSFPTLGMVEEGGEASLQAWDYEQEEVVDVADGIGNYELAVNREKLLLNLASGLYVVDAKAQPATMDDDTRVSLAGVSLELDPREEWKQIYFEAWRHEREFYWDAGMAGIDWKAVRDQYATMLPRISTRGELGDLLGELIGELGTSHTYVAGGDAPNRIDWVQPGLLGADLVREGDVYKVARVYHGDPADEVASPLRQPGQVVKEGEYILAINNRPFRKDRPAQAELEGKAGVPVMLTVNSTPNAKGARTVVVTPVDDEHDLRYVDWVRRNREYVAEKSGGKLGYVHVPNMGTEGLVAFETWYYPQLDKQGMVVDVRWNGGGFVSQLLIERLSRELVGFNRARNGGLSTYPYRTLNGPFVVLLNEFAGSDGDIFPNAVQQLKLAPVIGTRSWGGIVGIRNDKELVDGGMLTQPEFASWWPSGGWIVENHGIDPDMVVQNSPKDVAGGVDRQLDRAIAELTRLVVEQPPVVPTFGPVPPKSRDAYKSELP
ncbi:MAG: S41 family peptidase [Myxococcota bacterium]